MFKIKSILKWLTIASSLVLIFFLFSVWSFNYKIETGELTEWNGKFYTKEELAKNFPPQYYPVAPDKNKPEEVYARFREALLKKDINFAVRQIYFNKREKYRQLYEDTLKNEKDRFEKWVNSMPASIVKEKINDNFAYYLIDYGKGNNSISFIKNDMGYWSIDSI